MSKDKAKTVVATTAEEIVDELIEQRDKLQAFKDWVHAYLDSHGVPHHPPGTHGAAGCRIGDRMDWLMGRWYEANAEVKRLKYRLNHQTEDEVELCRQGKHEDCGK